jgi:hypothetical protein
MFILKRKDPTEYNGVEFFISEKLQEEDISWFPIEEARSLKVLAC